MILIIIFHFLQLLIMHIIINERKATGNQPSDHISQILSRVSDNACSTSNKSYNYNCYPKIDKFIINLISKKNVHLGHVGCLTCSSPANSKLLTTLPFEPHPRLYRAGSTN